VLLTGLAVALCPGLQAQSTNEWWPEVDTYLQLTNRLRASLFVARSIDRESYNSLEIGPNLDVTLKPFRNRKKTEEGLDTTKRTYLTFRVGYHSIFGSSGSRENRGILEVSPRFYAPKAILLTDRHRADLRDINGAFSWRYRNRLTVERAFRIKSLRLTPYLRGEVYYDSRYDVWNKNSYGGGVVFPVGKHLELEPYFQRDNDSRSSTAQVNAVGFTISLYFDRRPRRP
jgi:hypothetical protein